jgi:uncharacterized protein (DUF58 family)
VITIRGSALGALGVALLIAGFVYGVEEFVLVAVALAALSASGAGILWWRMYRARRSIRVEIRVPTADVSARQLADAQLHVFNTGRRSTAPLLVEEPARAWALSYPGLSPHGGLVAPHLEGGQGPPAYRKTGHVPASTHGKGPRLPTEARTLGDPVELPGLRPGSQAVVPIRVPTEARGLLTLHPLALWCEDPFRLFGSEVASTPAAHVLVCPMPAAATVAPLSFAGGSGTNTHDVGEHVRAEGMQGGYEFRSIRPYLPGDRLARLHWPAFARSGELAVRDFVEPVSGCVSLLVDLRPSAHRNQSLEAVISRVAAIGLRALESGEVVELCTSAGDRVEIAPGAESRRVFLRSLAVLGPLSAPVSEAVRWGGATGSAVWAPASREVSDLVLVTTAQGAENALPESLAERAATIVVG